MRDYNRIGFCGQVFDKYDLFSRVQIRRYWDICLFFISRLLPKSRYAQQFLEILFSVVQLAESIIGMHIFDCQSCQTFHIILSQNPQILLLLQDRAASAEKSIACGVSYSLSFSKTNKIDYNKIVTRPYFLIQCLIQSQILLFKSQKLME